MLTFYVLTELNQCVVLGRFEVDEYGNRKQQDSYPKAQTTVVTNLTGREMLMLGIQALWRVDPQFYLHTFKALEPETRHEIAVKLWETNMDLSVKISAASTYRALTSAAFQTPSGPSLPYQDQLVDLFMSSL